jgi:hypothetical protein
MPQKATKTENPAKAAEEQNDQKFSKADEKDATAYSRCMAWQLFRNAHGRLCKKICEHR